MIPGRGYRYYASMLLFVVVNALHLSGVPVRLRSRRETSNGPTSTRLHVELQRQLFDRPVQHVKRRPALQRVTKARTARRMNHGFRHLYRHPLNTTTANVTEDPMKYLMMEGNFTISQILQMNESFPMLLQLSVSRQLRPKMMFLKHTLQVSDPCRIFHVLPPQYFGARLERTLAPRHAFLTWMGLPAGHELFQRTDGSGKTLFESFMKSGRNSKQFAAMCQSWRRIYSRKTPHPIPGTVTSTHVEAFELLFSRGLLSAARNELCETKWAAAAIPMLAPVNLTVLLVQHGANPKERDHRGATLLHWACGCGNWKVAAELISHCSAWDDQSRDGSTPLHWAAAGATPREFGVGGHVDVCRNLLIVAEESAQVQDYVNCLTKDGNSALMWAAWSGTLDTVKLLARHRADATIANRNGCTVAHWAASGGNLEGMWHELIAAEPISILIGHFFARFTSL